MAISDVKEYTHLTEEEVEQIGRELDAIRAEIEESRGAADAAYINRLITVQRGLAAAGRVALFASNRTSARTLGISLLALAKILENMEIGHNVMHGQWDWMNDPEIHSSTWEWDTAQPAEQWKHSHNYVHHQFTNVLGYDNDIGYGILRMAREQKWHPANLGQPLYNAMLATAFEWGVALHDLDIERIRKGEKDPQEMKRQLRQIVRKGRNQILKDYVVYPALAGRHWRSTLTANLTANVIRNLWSYVIIFCGHFPDGALHFTEDEIEDETRSEWYLRQILGAANFRGGPLLHILSGNLGFQIEHHLYPDLPSNRYAEISERVRALCEKYDIPYTTGPLHVQYCQALRTIVKLSVPNDWTSTDQPDPPSPARERRRKSDAERPPRRRELGGWSRSPRQRGAA
ncbi:fatty acid desaturase family protein [Nocardioides coralli]|uniref:fatty acid desaturase family protein n=1 Tax=Nocardioides coralli TaxID=2872154 RepID=UPI001CA3EF6E|nr:acyl-CoA desaturase [Nocardioides coralli]QZY29781.1 acyl-CoA desaturase [Nocardioides coralli]